MVGWPGNRVKGATVLLNSSEVVADGVEDEPDSEELCEGTSVVLEDSLGEVDSAGAKVVIISAPGIRPRVMFMHCVSFLSAAKHRSDTAILHSSKELPTDPPTSPEVSLAIFNRSLKAELNRVKLAVSFLPAQNEEELLVELVIREHRGSEEQAVRL
jgi:hypothetical protein